MQDQSQAPQLVVDCRNSVGESITWDDRNGTLVWVDIGGGLLHRLELATGRHTTTQPPARPSSIGLAAGGGYIVGLMKEVVLWDGGAVFTPLARIEPDLPDNRLNEGQVAPDGSYWVGTMQNNLAADGSPQPIEGQKGRLYRVAPDGTVSLLSSDRFGITNTMVWLDDGRFVTADTTLDTLYAYTVGPQGLADRQVFAASPGRGLPDGSTGDGVGHVWNCRVVGGASLAEFDPQGRLLRLVELPCSWPTSCCFGGPDLDTLFVTSARFTMSEAHLAAHPQEGNLFALKPGRIGRPARRFGA